MQLTPGISTSLSITDLCLPIAAWQLSVVGYYRICQLGSRNGTEYSLLCISLCLTVWLCLRTGSENMVLMRLLRIGAKDLNVYSIGLSISNQRVGESVTIIKTRDASTFKTSLLRRLQTQNLQR